MIPPSRPRRQPHAMSLATLFCTLALLLASLSGLQAATRTAQVSPLRLISVTEDDDGGVRLRIAALGSEFELDLHPSEAVAEPKLIAPSASLQSLADIRFYAGSVVGADDSWVRLTRRGDLFTGTLRAWQRMYRIDQQGGIEPRGDDELVMIDVTDGDQGDAFGTDHALVPPLASVDAAARQASEEIARALPRNGEAPTRVVHIAVLVDTLFDERNAGQGALQALSVLNSVDGIFREELGVALRVALVKVLDENDDPMRDASRANNGAVSAVLDAFVDYRRRDPDLAAGAAAELDGELGLVHLFSGTQDPGDVIGLAWIDTACRGDGYDTSLSTPFIHDVQLVAHELGHSLGAVHDDLTACAAQPDLLMWPLFTAQMQSRFSQCSLDDMAARVAASCNDDNIDLAVQLASNGTPIVGRTTLVDLLVFNRDAQRDAAQITSQTRIPDTLALVEVPQSCRLDGDLLHCDHGDLRVGEQTSLQLQLRLLSREVMPLVSSVDARGVYDLASADNRFSLYLSNPVAQSGGGADWSVVALASLFAVLPGRLRRRRRLGVSRADEQNPKHEWR